MEKNPHKESKFTLNAAIENLDKLSSIGKSLLSEQPPSEASEQKAPEPNDVAYTMHQLQMLINFLDQKGIGVKWNGEYWVDSQEQKPVVTQSVTYITCDGQIQTNGICNKCGELARTTSSYCLRQIPTPTIASDNTMNVTQSDDGTKTSDVYQVNREIVGDQSVTTIYKNGELMRHEREPLTSLDVSLTQSEKGEEIFHRFVMYEWNDYSPAFKQSFIEAVEGYAQSERSRAREETIEDCIKSIIRVAGIKYFQKHEAVAVLGEAMAELEKLKSRQ